MKIKTVILFFVLFLPDVLFSETIFIYTVSEGTEDTLKTSVPYLEDGIFKTLFDAGHIVFNDSSVNPVRERGLETYKEPEDFITAKSGGASFLMEIQVHYRIEKEKEIPVYADYRLFNVISGKLLSNGTSRIAAGDETITSEKRLEDMGMRMAENILSFL